MYSQYPRSWSRKLLRFRPAYCGRWDLVTNQSKSSSQIQAYSQLWVRTADPEQLQFPLDERENFIHRLWISEKPENFYALPYGLFARRIDNAEWQVDEVGKTHTSIMLLITPAKTVPLLARKYALKTQDHFKNKPKVRGLLLSSSKTTCFHIWNSHQKMEMKITILGFGTASPMTHKWHSQGPSTSCLSDRMAWGSSFPVWFLC